MNEKNERKEDVRTKEAEIIVDKVEKAIEKQKTDDKSGKIHDETKIKEHLERSKEYSLKDGAYLNATVGFGENYMSAYAVALKASAHEIGLLTSIPNMIAPLAQLATSRYMEKHSRRSIVSIALFFEILMWLPIIAVAFLFLKDIKYAPLLLVLFYTIYALFRNFASPAWVSWMGDIVHTKESGVFFGKRNKLGGISALISMVLAGILLDLFKLKSMTSTSFYLPFLGFIIIFLLAMFSRVISRYYVLKQYEPHFRFQKEAYFSFWQFVKKIPQSNYGKFALFVALMHLAQHIASSYYALYMLRDLQFSYVQFMAINVSASIATFIFMTKWGKFSDRFGNIKVAKVCSMLIPVVCFLWSISMFIAMPYKLYFLLLANFFSGFAWAGFNLAVGNFVYEAATPQRRGLCSAYSSILNGFGIVIGVTIGSILISNLNITFMNVILFVSLLSGVARYAVAITFFGKIKDVRNIEEKSHWSYIPLASEIYNLNDYIAENFLRVKGTIKKDWKPQANSNP
ncbi:MAG: MFS transporter [Nanoarchaeota archaeon]|nr:MFS transporter [Nanoarchaeota archaeon]